MTSKNKIPTLTTTYSKKTVIGYMTGHSNILTSYEYKGKISRYMRIKNAKKTIYTWATNRYSRRQALGKTIIWGTSIAHR